MILYKFGMSILLYLTTNTYKYHLEMIIKFIEI